MDKWFSGAVTQPVLLAGSCPCSIAWGGPWLYLEFPGMGKVGGFCLVSQAAMSEPGLKGLGRGVDSVFLIWLSHVLVVQSLTPAELVVSVCTSYCLQMELGAHLFRGPALVRVLGALRRSDKQPSEQSICSG